MKKTHRLRVLIVALVSLLVFIVIEVRLHHVQIVRHEHYRALAARQHGKTVTLAPRRGDILDRNGQPLATSTFYDTIYFNPWKLKRRPPRDAAARVARVLGRPESSIQRILDSNTGRLLARKVTPEAADAMRLLEDSLGLPDGVFRFEKQSKRLYPKGNLAGPVIGFAGLDDGGDNVGLEGLEKQYNEHLRGAQQKQRVPVNSWRQGLAPMEEKALEATFGRTLVLTLDSQIQLFAQKALTRRVGEVQAKSGVAVVMEVKTGAILAMASCPDFDPNEFARAESLQRRNRALTDPIEVGSVMKILTATIMIDNNLLHADEMIDCKNGRWFIQGRRFTDSHPLGVVPYREAFANSSNIAHAMLGLRISKQLYHDSLQRFGLGQVLGIDLPGEGRGILYPVSKWSDLSRTSLPVGYETSLTALQVVTAVSAVANGGIRMRPYIVQRILSADGRLVEEFEPVRATRVAGPDACRTVVELMELVVTEGTGTAARIPGYRVGGKTGTTKKTGPERRYIASFVGILPIEDPQIAIYVYVNEPNPKIDFYGGKVAAPVFTEIARKAIRILGIPASDPSAINHDPEPTEIAGARPETTESGDTGWPEPIDGADRRTAKEFATQSRDQARAWLSISDAESPSLPFDPVETVRVGRMPICLGLTATEVLQRTIEARMPVKLFGSGVAVQQYPQPGARLPEGEEAMVIFEPPSRRVAAFAHSAELPFAEAASADGLEDESASSGDDGEEPAIR